MQDLLITSNTGLQVELADFGARILDLRLPHEGKLQSVVRGYNTAQDYLDDQVYMGATVGPIANRIRHGRFVVDNQPVQLPTNRQGHSLHSGELGFDRQFWQIEQQATDHVQFSLKMAARPNSLPGNLSAFATYTARGDALIIDYLVESDAPTYLNLTNHVYWNLNSDRNRIQSHDFLLFAKAIAEKDREGIPDGTLKPVESPLRLSLCEDLANNNGTSKVDEHFVVDEQSQQLKKMAVVTSPASNLQLTVLSTKPGFQLYSGHFLTSPLEPFAGFCVEPQYAPNAINCANFLAPLVMPSRPYRHTIEYRLDRA